MGLENLAEGEQQTTPEEAAQIQSSNGGKILTAEKIKELASNLKVRPSIGMADSHVEIIHAPDDDAKIREAAIQTFGKIFRIPGYEFDPKSNKVVKLHRDRVIAKWVENGGEIATLKKNGVPSSTNGHNHRNLDPIDRIEQLIEQEAAAKLKS